MTLILKKEQCLKAAASVVGPRPSHVKKLPFNLFSSCHLN